MPTNRRRKNIALGTGPLTRKVCVNQGERTKAESGVSNPGHKEAKGELRLRPGNYNKEQCPEPPQARARDPIADVTEGMDW